MSNMSPSLEYFKSIDVNTIYTKENIDTNEFLITVVLYTTNIKTLEEECQDYSVSVFCENKNSHILYPTVFCREFTDKTKAIEYIEFLKNKISLNNDTMIFKAIKEDNLSLL